MDISSPLVSVIIPVFNVELYLRQCLDSVINQTYKNLEILVIDDGSTDNCGKICDEYEKDRRVKVFHTENRGLSAATNLGLDNATGDYISFIDSDDWIDVDFLKRQIESIDDADVLCISKYEGIYNGLEALSALINHQIGDVAWNKLYKKECFRKSRFPEGRVFEDVAIMYKVLHQSRVVRCKGINGYHHRKRCGSITQSKDSKVYFDYWHAYLERFKYCERFVSGRTRINLLQSCAEAIAAAWAWRIVYYPNNCPEWDEVSSFAKKMFPYSMRKYFPLRVQGGILMARYNKRWSFWLAHKMNLLTRK